VSTPVPRQGIGSPGQATVAWLPWGKEAFARAQAEDKPVLLSIGAVWCHWCHYMDQNSYTDPKLADFINRNFIAIRVDTEHQPHINVRYNVGGWPTTAFLTAHGGLIGGATYLPADQLLAMLMDARRAYGEHKASLYDQALQSQRQRQERADRVSGDAELSAGLVDRIARRVAGTYDVRHGGFGEEPKFPAAAVLRLLLHLFRTTGEEFYRVMLAKTLDQMARSPLWDSLEGGFFRYSSSPDWSSPQYEKLLEDNLALLRVYADAALLLHQEEYRRIASRIVDFLLERLLDSRLPGFRGSQGAHSAYFGLPPAARRELPAPPVDQFSYTHWNTLAVSVLLEASWKLNRPELSTLALQVLHGLDAAVYRGRLRHVLPAEGSAVQDTELLADRAGLLNACMDANWHTGDEQYLQSARDSAEKLLDRFFDQSKGGFFDIESDADPLGLLKIREKPLPENMAAVQGLMKLHYATQDEGYRQAAQRTLSAFAEANRDYGEFAASYALALDMCLNKPLEVVVEGSWPKSDTAAMLRAAAQLKSAHLVLKLSRSQEATSPARAHVCLDAACLPPVTDPSRLAALVEEMAVPHNASPFANIMDRFPGL